MVPMATELDNAQVDSAPENLPLQQSEGPEVRSGSEMKCLSSSLLWGCNLYHETTVIRQEVNLGAVAGLHSGQAGPDFAARFVERFGGLETPNSGNGLKAGFLDRLNSTEGAPFSEVVLQAILAVEDSLAYSMRWFGGIAFSEVVPGSSPEQAILVWSCRNPEVSRRVTDVCLIGIAELFPGALRRHSGTAKESFKTAYRSLRKFSSRWKRDYNTSVVVQAAEERGIPWEPIGGRYLRLGQGKFQHRINYSATENTSFLAQRFSRDKQITHRLLADVGVPVPKQVKVSNAGEALRAAKRIGYPVVIKPVNGNKGRGVCVGLKGPDEIASAFEHASRFGSGVIVESSVEGQDFRLLVVDGQMIAAMKRVPPFVIGDGSRTIGALVEELNRDPRRDGRMLKQVILDEALNRLLGGMSYDLNTVLGQGEKVVLRETSNISTGGITVDVTDEVHPENSMMAIRAAAAIGLDVTGVDLVTTDISQSYKKVGGAILEVNVRPGIDMHIWPIEGKGRDTPGAVIETMLLPDTQGRVPVALVIGRRGRGGRVADVLDGILRSVGLTVGLVSRKAAFVDGEPAGPERATRRRATQFVLRHPLVEAVVGAVSPFQVARRGLIHDRCDVAAIIDTGNSDNVEEVRQGLEVVVKATRGKLVVDADSSLAAEAVRDIDPKRLVIVSLNAGKDALRQQLAGGGAVAATARDKGKRVILLMDGERTVLTVPVAAIPALAEKRSRRRIKTFLFAVAMAHAMGRKGEEIVSALRSSQSRLGGVSPSRETAHENWVQ